MENERSSAVPREERLDNVMGNYPSWDGGIHGLLRRKGLRAAVLSEPRVPRELPAGEVAGLEDVAAAALEMATA